MDTFIGPILVVIAIGGIIYNIIVTHTVVKNDLHHLETSMKEYKVDNIREHKELKDMVSCILKKVMAMKGDK